MIDSRFERLCQSADEVAVAEFSEVEIVVGPGCPEAQRIDRAAAISDDRPVVGHADQRGGPAGDRPQASPLHLERAIQFDFDLFPGPNNLPGIGASQPVVRLFVLPTVFDRLAEHAVFVTNPVAHRRKLHGGHRVEKARGKPAKSAVAQPSVGLLLQQP